jgi:OOP family OmpA-OmpF porin
MRVWNFAKPSVITGAALLFVFGATGCATKKHVRGVVAPVEARVAASEKKSADQAAAIGELEVGLSKADERAMDADRKAVAAGQEAAKAGEAAKAAQMRADNAQARADNAHQIGEQNRSRLGEVVENIDNYQLVTTESVLFPLNRANLTQEGKAQLDAAVANIKNAKNYQLEVQGFTDRTGSVSTNLALSQKRADAVVRYLTVEHQIPLRKISVLGIGEDAPLADNKTRAGRKQNRRVELKVYALDLNKGTERSGTQASSTPAPQN